MWEVNTEKCLRTLSRVYVSSDDQDILLRATEMGAIPILRGSDLCGDTPNIPVYRHALAHMSKDINVIFAVQANSPTISLCLLLDAKDLMEKGTIELMTCHPDYKFYGSIWAMTEERLMNYRDFYRPTPEILLVDPSVDIHTQEDLEKALRQ